MTGLIRIPQKFYDDCIECANIVPKIIRKTQQHYFIHEDDKLIHDLLSRAEFYADPWGPEGEAALIASAKATVRAIRSNEKWTTVKPQCNDELYDSWDPQVETPLYYS